MNWIRALFRRRQPSHLELVRMIADTFGMPKHVRAFKIEWRVNGALTVTVEHYPWKSHPIRPALKDLAVSIDEFEIRPVRGESVPLELQEQ